MYISLAGRRHSDRSDDPPRRPSHIAAASRWHSAAFRPPRPGSQVTAQPPKQEGGGPRGKGGRGSQSHTAMERSSGGRDDGVRRFGDHGAGSYDTT